MQNGCSSLISTTKKGCKAFSSRSKWAPSNQTKSIVVLCHDDKCPLRVPRGPNQNVELKGANITGNLSEAVRFSPENYHSLVFPEENKAKWLTAPITQFTGFHWSVICWWVTLSQSGTVLSSTTNLSKTKCWFQQVFMNSSPFHFIQNGTSLIGQGMKSTFNLLKPVIPKIPLKGHFGKNKKKPEKKRDDTLIHISYLSAVQCQCNGCYCCH